MATHSPLVPRPFEALDRDWAITCRQHRRSDVMACWAREEPALAGVHRLADLIPTVDVDRAPIAAAVARVHIAGDNLAQRALLQLLIPGMVRLTAKWRHRFGTGVAEVGWDVVSRSTIYIALLRERNIRCSPAGYVLASVHRDLLNAARNDDAQPAVPLDNAPGSDNSHDHLLTVPSAEEIASSGVVVRLALEGAVAKGDLPPASLELMWLILCGHSVEEAANHTAHPISTAYRHRAKAIAHLCSQLLDAFEEM